MRFLFDIINSIVFVKFKKQLVYTLFCSPPKRENKTTNMTRIEISRQFCSSDWLGGASVRELLLDISTRGGLSHLPQCSGEWAPLIRTQITGNSGPYDQMLSVGQC
jgi:hypothetical protein